MESEKFDRLVRQAFAGRSRRSMLRFGGGALAASALAALGLGSQDAEGKKKKKRICDCSSSDPSSCNSRRLKRKRAKRIVRNNPCAYNGRCTGVSGCPAPQCVAPRPVTCGAGCCPAEFSKCCQDVSDPVSPVTCNPSDYNCCAVSEGGGSCPPATPKCCPITPNNRFGACCEADQSCCNVDEDCTGDGETCNSGCCSVSNGVLPESANQRFYMPAE